MRKEIRRTDGFSLLLLGGRGSNSVDQVEILGKKREIPPYNYH